MNEQINIGDILVKSYGYGMILFTFYQVIRTSDKSIWIQKMKKKMVSGDCFRPEVIPDGPDSEEPIRRVSRTTYIGSKWDNKPLQEDHLD